ncbi:hypothetical protein AERO8C_150221 [Aeromonas veronii]|uniref:Uncharacterized protein n=1 Tax=Aeromonas veronii TaxID=654 RepID=A0A653KVK8_AERVE|nr:hypothetical protein AERO8C_150221 [Aeromonas veronii]
MTKQYKNNTNNELYDTTHKNQSAGLLASLSLSP